MMMEVIMIWYSYISQTKDLVLVEPIQTKSKSSDYFWRIWEHALSCVLE